MIESAPAYPWVSRGGVKLAAVLDAFGFDPAGHFCLDVGASTGGFTHVLLARGAAKSFAWIQGTANCMRRSPAIRASYRSRDRRAAFNAGLLARAPSFVTCDVSFISLALILPAVLPLAAPEAVARRSDQTAIRGRSRPHSQRHRQGRRDQA